MKSNIGYLQEELPSGKVANSNIRLLSFIAMGVFLAYLVAASLSYEQHFNKYVELIKAGVIEEASFNTLILGLNRFDWNFVVILLVAAFVPKVIQKFAENKTGVTTTESSSSESSKTTIQ